MEPVKMKGVVMKLEENVKLVQNFILLKFCIQTYILRLIGHPIELFIIKDEEEKTKVEKKKLPMIKKKKEKKKNHSLN